MWNDDGEVGRVERRRRRRPGSIVRATSIICLTGERQRGIGEAVRENDDDGSRSSEATGEAGTLSETEQGAVGCPQRTESEHVEAVGSDVSGGGEAGRRHRFGVRPKLG
ncbi:hypothetical protein [Arthrobacter sp. G119Y2]|uniref:hypothetical protein n=1 Tax=Arthrobacter sp. G119Y2 TaxID=3134965 RepID=UPI0031198304